MDGKKFGLGYLDWKKFGQEPIWTRKNLDRNPFGLEKIWTGTHLDMKNYDMGIMTWKIMKGNSCTFLEYVSVE